MKLDHSFDNGFPLDLLVSLKGYMNTYHGLGFWTFYYYYDFNNFHINRLGHFIRDAWSSMVGTIIDIFFTFLSFIWGHLDMYLYFQYTTYLNP